MLHKYNGVSPTIHETAFIADSADIIGNVSIGADSSVWFNATVRADSGTITIGEGTSIQDNCVVHVDPGVDEYIGNHVTVGHGAILHGATIEDNCLIGMGAVILSGAVIGHGSIVGAGSVVPPKMIIPPNSQVMGTPARIVKELPEGQEEKMSLAALEYVKFKNTYMTPEE